MTYISSFATSLSTTNACARCSPAHSPTHQLPTCTSQTTMDDVSRATEADVYAANLSYTLQELQRKVRDHQAKLDKVSFRRVIRAPSTMPSLTLKKPPDPFRANRGLPITRRPSYCHKNRSNKHQHHIGALPPLPRLRPARAPRPPPRAPNHHRVKGVPGIPRLRGRA